MNYVARAAEAARRWRETQGLTPAAAAPRSLASLSSPVQSRGESPPRKRETLVREESATKAIEATKEKESGGREATTSAASPLRSGAPGFAEAVARLLGLPLDRLDCVVTMRVPWLDVPLWFVPAEADAEALVAAGEATRGAVWTTTELLDLRAIPGLTKAQAWTVALAKVGFDGDVMAVRPGEHSEACDCRTCIP